MDRVKRIINDSLSTFKKAADDTSLLKNIDAAVAAIIKCIISGGKVLVCGNGGSAADSQHFAAELVGSFLIKKRAAFPAISLTTDTSILTSVGNDVSFETIFSRQVEALGKSGDILVGITTSGKSKNVLLAFDAAKANGLKTICVTGALPSGISLADINLEAPSSSTPRIQEVHSLLIHIICELVEHKLSKAE